MKRALSVQLSAVSFWAAALTAHLIFAQSGIPRRTPDVRFENSPRVHELMRAGNLYLGLQDALSLAIVCPKPHRIEGTPPGGITRKLRAMTGSCASN